MKWPIALLVLAAPFLIAAKVGDNLYVKAKNTKVMESSGATAGVITVLQPGEAVTWGGSDPANKMWHKVTVNGKSGVVFQSNLSPNKPAMEMVAGSGGKVDPKAFASSGAATKALGEGAKNYGDKKDMKETVVQLEKVEDAAKAVTTNDIAKHADAAGLFPVVGGSDE